MSVQVRPILHPPSLSGATDCLDSPVAPTTPTTKNLFVDTVKERAVDKIDLLFMIDDSLSMADKPDILAAAVPRLVDRRISPIQEV